MTRGVKCKVHSGLVHYGSLCHCPCSGLAENARLRGEVRRLRRALTRTGYIVAMPKKPEPNVCGCCGDSFCTDADREDVGFCNGCAQEMVEQIAGMVEAALAPRRRAK